MVVELVLVTDPPKVDGAVYSGSSALLYSDHGCTIVAWPLLAVPPRTLFNSALIVVSSVSYKAVFTASHLFLSAS